MNNVGITMGIALLFVCLSNSHSTSPDFTNDDTGWHQVIFSTAVNQTIILIPTNFGMRQFAINAYCSLRRLNRTEVVLVAFDTKALDVFRQQNIPAYIEPTVRIASEQGRFSERQSSFRTDDFLRLTCGKLWAVLSVLRLGVNVLLVDADVVFLADPLANKNLPWENDVTFSDARPKAPARECALVGSQKWHQPNPICEVNTGYYFAVSRSRTVQLFHRLNQTCFSFQKAEVVKRPNAKHRSDRKAFWYNDQSIAQQVLERDVVLRRKAQTALQQQFSQVSSNQSSSSSFSQLLAFLDYRWGCFDPCWFANGRVFFEHRQPQRAGITPVMVHACFIEKKLTKINKLREHGLWRPQC